MTREVTCLDRGMTNTRSDNGSTRPRVLRARTGWLAVSPEGFRPRIGAIGTTEEEARQCFAEELAAWRELHERPDPTPMRQPARL